MSDGRITAITIAFDHDTSQVGMNAESVPVALAQMMLDEAVRQLDFIRRRANMQQIQQEAADAALAASLTGAGRHRG